MELDLSPWAHLNLSDEERRTLMETLSTELSPRPGRVLVPQIDRNKKGRLEVCILCYKEGYYNVLLENGQLTKPPLAVECSS